MIVLRQPRTTWQTCGKAHWPASRRTSAREDVRSRRARERLQASAADPLTMDASSGSNAACVACISLVHGSHVPSARSTPGGAPLQFFTRIIRVGGYAESTSPNLDYRIPLHIDH